MAKTESRVKGDEVMVLCVLKFEMSPKCFLSRLSSSFRIKLTKIGCFLLNPFLWNGDLIASFGSTK